MHECKVQIRNYSNIRNWYKFLFVLYSKSSHVKDIWASFITQFQSIVVDIILH
jgi:hypothetical protein